MPDVTVIGRGTNIVGRVSGALDLAIHGRIEGEVAVDGEVTIESEGLALASLTGRRVIVRGAVKGDVHAEEAILLEEGARVQGDLRAPRVAVLRGALVRGYVQTSGAGSNESRSRDAKATRPAQRNGPPMRAPAPPPRKAAASTPSLLAGTPPKQAAKGPPPPVVPVLRKGAKGALKKRAG
jgi:cytoskeletal protein CcmA (bactofilin family)